MKANNQVPRRDFMIGAAVTTVGLLGAGTAASSLLGKEKTMFTIRKSSERGLADHGWLKSRHTFSFANYYDPAHMGFGPLRVINEDRIAGGTGFGTHPHNDMEIISYVISGGLKHRDSMGNETVIKPGEVQRMSAGTGIRHSEYNEKETDETHFFQIWIMPEARGITPSYGQKSFEKELASEKLVHVVSKDGRNGTITMNQDANVYISRLKADESFSLNLGEYRRLWVQVVKGSVEVNGQKIETGDAASATDIASADFKASADSELILFDLP
jgi:redox-sensitive bicupin YhaK (pirin superfamily)